MKYNDVINHPSLKDYFGKNSEKWIDALNSLVEKKNLGEKEVDDKEARELLNRSFKFSWLGFFFQFYWAAYHNINGWINVCLMFGFLQAIDTLFFEANYAWNISIVVSMLYGIFGKSLLLGSKADELTKTSNLSSPSWGRVAVSILIIFVSILIPVTIAEL